MPAATQKRADVQPCPSEHAAYLHPQKGTVRILMQMREYLQELYVDSLLGQVIDVDELIQLAQECHHSPLGLGALHAGMWASPSAALILNGLLISALRCEDPDMAVNEMLAYLRSYPASFTERELLELLLMLGLHCGIFSWQISAAVEARLDALEK